LFVLLHNHKILFLKKKGFEKKKMFTHWFKTIPLVAALAAGAEASSVSSFCKFRMSNTFGKYDCS